MVPFSVPDQPSAHHTAVQTIDPPLDTKQLREALKAFLDQRVPGLGRLGSCKHGLYAFFDYDGEPIYVGQTVEQIGTRVRRHLTNQRTDAVAMGVLDPYEVRTVKVWPIWPEQIAGLGTAKVRELLDGYEADLFEKLIAESRFNALLNEKLPPIRRGASKPLPSCFAVDLVGAEVAALRDHPDVRLARRASAIAKLAQIIAERKVSKQLRRVLVAQAKRLTWLAEQRAAAFAHSADESEET